MRSSPMLVKTLCVGVALVTAASAWESEAMAGARDCPADFDMTGDVAFADLLQLLAAWGPCDAPCPPDFDGDTDVDFADLLVLLADWGPCASEEIVHLRMAGNSMDQYPFFEFVRAFNEGTPVQIAIDPANLPGSGFLEADVYITDPLAVTEGAALVDVRGGPQSVTFGGSSIQTNTFTLTGSDEIDSNAGLDIGVPYHLVVDFNQNGVLDGGDYLDGSDSVAGFYVLHDLTQPGPIATTSATYTIELLTGAFQQERTFYPTDIASLGPRPLIVIGHGGGHNFQWYDYLQEHLASYGYIVMSHENSFPFPPAVQRILLHTDAIIERQDTILGGALDGLIDTTRIAWIGHSLGGRAVLLGYDLLAESAFVPENYGVDDVKLLCGIASNSLEGPADADPHEAPFHLMFGSADGDISGSPSCDQCQPFRHYDRARGPRHATYIHGADHNDFNCCGIPNFTGPPETEIGPEESQRIAKAVYLSLMKRYLENNVPAKEVLWRQWERFNPIGVSDDTIVVCMFDEAQTADRFAIDDFQTSPTTGTSSSGGFVTFDVGNFVEDRLDDNNASFTWIPSDPMNGMTYAHPLDTTRGIVFDWMTGSDRFLEFAVVSDGRDFSQFDYVSFRACQGSRHPETIAEKSDLTFTVTLRDEDGATSSINIGAYGGGIEETYPRTGFGDGAGWQNEFETVRMRITDFLHNGGAIDLTRIEAVRFEFGSSFGSSRGRLGFDDLAILHE